MDDTYHYKQKLTQQTQVKSTKRGVLVGVEALGAGFREGAKGVLLKPLQGAMDQGAKGFVKGVGHGLLGAVAQPLSGVATLASKTTEGMASDARRVMVVGNRAIEWTQIRIRQPRSMGPNAVLLCYPSVPTQVMTATIRWCPPTLHEKVN